MFDALVILPFILLLLAFFLPAWRLRRLAWQTGPELDAHGKDVARHRLWLLGLVNTLPFLFWFFSGVWLDGYPAQLFVPLFLATPILTIVVVLGVVEWALGISLRLVWQRPSLSVRVAQLVRRTRSPEALRQLVWRYLYDPPALRQTGRLRLLLALAALLLFVGAGWLVV